MDISLNALKQRHCKIKVSKFICLEPNKNVDGWGHINVMSADIYRGQYISTSSQFVTITADGRNALFSIKYLSMLFTKDQK